MLYRLHSVYSALCLDLFLFISIILLPLKNDESVLTIKKHGLCVFEWLNYGRKSYKHKEGKQNRENYKKIVRNACFSIFFFIIQIREVCMSTSCFECLIVVKSFSISIQKSILDVGMYVNKNVRIFSI